ncbi:hypothetical protein [Rhodococcus sp. ABRD24]|nr:hypothetical protein [Rhodococcus sp. ABRD24]
MLAASKYHLALANAALANENTLHRELLQQRTAYEICWKPPGHPGKH